MMNVEEVEKANWMSENRPKCDEHFRLAALEQLEHAFVGLLAYDGEGLGSLSQDLKDRLLFRALEAKSVMAIAQLLDAGARIESLQYVEEPRREEYKGLLEQATARKASSASSPVDFEKNMAIARNTLRQSLDYLAW